MKPTAIRRTSCRLCEGGRLERAIPMRPSPIADDYIGPDRLAEEQPLFDLDVYLCADCGHAQLLEVVDASCLFTNYIYTTSISTRLVQEFQTLSRDLTARFALRPNDLVLDIGSNDGTFLGFLRSSGCRVLGVDPAVEIARKATESGVETVPAFFGSDLADSQRAKHGPAKMMTAFNVFAHSDNLGDMTDGIRRLLAPDGVFVFEVSYLVDILDRWLFDTIYHEHLSYHSVAPLQTFFGRHGLQLFSVDRISSKGGSLRGFVQLAGGPRPVDPSVQSLLDLERSIGLRKIAPFRRFADALEERKTRLHALLDEIPGGGTIAGYGASATVTTLLYHFELTGRLGFLVDDNTRRHGLFSPGCHLPIHAPDKLVTDHPRAAVILAWQYAQPILARNSQFLDAGGRFVIPLPEPRVIDRR